MKAVIVDLSGQRAAALCEDGSVREVPNLDYDLGQEIEIGQLEESRKDSPKSTGKTAFRKWYRKIASAAAIVLLLTGIGGVSVYAMPYGEVSLDAGTSVTYTINRFDYVLSAKAADEAGEQIIEEIGEKNIVNKKIDTAVALTLDRIQQEEGSDSEMEYHVRTDIGSDGKSADEAHARKLQGMLEEVLAEKVPEEPEKGSEEKPAMHPDGNFEGSSEPTSSEPVPEDRFEEEPEEFEGNSESSPKDQAGPAAEPDVSMENMQDENPADSGNAPQSGTDGDVPEVPQRQSEEKPEERHDNAPQGGFDQDAGKPLNP